MDPVRAVHSDDFIAFLETAWQEWQDAGFTGEAIASSWPARRMQSRVPASIDGKVGYYALAAETSITEGTWTAVLASKDVALSGAKALHPFWEKILPQIAGWASGDVLCPVHVSCCHRALPRASVCLVSGSPH